jgi:hypothetical protein
MTIRQQLDHIWLQIMNGRLDEADLALARLETSDRVEGRIKAHYSAILAFHRGRVGLAREMMEQAIMVFGENLNLLRDLAVCQYHLHDMIGFRSNINRLEVLMAEKESVLEKRTLLECELMIGKFMEEEARLAPAVLFYERALNRAGGDAIPRFRVLVQKARWQALYEPGPELSHLYRELISFPADKITRDQRVELQHALMMIELRLVGADHAWQRIQRLGTDMVEMDRRLLVFDFVEGAVAQDLPVGPAVLNILNEFQELDPYELFLKKVVQDLHEQANTERPLNAAGRYSEELEHLAAKLSWSSYLRLLCLSANLETNASARQELNRKLQLIVRGLDTRSQALWNQRLKQALQTPEIKLELSMRNRTITVQGKSVDLSKKKIGLQLLSGLRNATELSVEQAIQLLWQSTFTPEHYHRLRMSTHRLNTLIHEITGLGKIIEVDSQTVRLRPEVKLKCADAAPEPEFLDL